MIDIIQDLVQHKAYANAALLRAICEHKVARGDEELRKLLHHIILANRFWFSLTLGRSFAAELESKVPGSLESDRYIEKLMLRNWTGSRRLQRVSWNADWNHPSFRGKSFSVAQGIMQVCMHSQGHRSQCASRLRGLGGTPPTLDSILWLRQRPFPIGSNWSGFGEM
jgi:uncharacterized damage-inducible protein DinB